MTVSDMEVPYGSPSPVSTQPVGVNARARDVKRSVTDRARQRTSRIVRIVYSDTADSWLLQERSPSARTVWATDYTSHLDNPWGPYRAWAKAWRPAAVLFALLCDAVKFFLIHPARGPVTVLTVAALTAAVALA
jgi:hypothetical protein